MKNIVSNLRLSCLVLLMSNMLMITMLSNVAFCLHGVDDLHVIKDINHTEVVCDGHGHEEEKHMSMSCFDVVVDQLLIQRHILDLELENNSPEAEPFLSSFLYSSTRASLSNDRLPIDHSIPIIQIHQALKKIRLLI